MNNDFRELWGFLCLKKEVYMSRISPRKWGKIDRVEDWLREKELFENGKGPFIVRGGVCKT